jgi:hypothetical protein
VIASDAQPLAAAATGTFWHDFSVDSTIETLSLEVQGGDAEVLLIAEDEVVRRAHGVSDALWTPVVFQLAELRGKTLRVALYDHSTETAVRVRNIRVF